MESLIYFVVFCVVLENAICLQYESAFDVQLYKSVLNSDLCDQQIQLIRSTPSLKQRFIDVNANIPHDLSAKGGLIYTGDYVGCLALHEHNNGNDIQGKYTQVTLDAPEHINNYKYTMWDNFTWKEVVNNFYKRQSIQLYYLIGCKAVEPNSEYWARQVNTTTITLGFCIPKPCSASQAIDFVLDTDHRPLTLGGKIIQRKYLETFYRLPADKPLSSPDIIFIIVSSCIIMMAILGTINDIKDFNITDSAKLRSLLRCFSVHKNIHQLLKIGSPRDSVECVDGIRAIAMALILWYHCYYKMTYTGVYSYKYSDSSDFLFYSVLVLSAYGVDTFLLLGGIFNVYSTMRRYKNPNSGPFVRDLHMHLLNRMVRLYPVLCFAVLVQASVMFHIGDGPRWYSMAGEVDACRQMNNTKEVFKMVVAALSLGVTVWPKISLDRCFLHAWYLSLDMQLFLLSALVLIYLLGKKNSSSWTVLVIPLLLSMGFSTTLGFLYNFKTPLYNVAIHPEFDEQYYKQYYSLLCRAPPYFAGMVVGCFLIGKKDIKLFLHVKKMWIWFLWMISIFLLVLSVTSMTILWDYLDSQVLHNLINSNMPVIWSFSVSWIIIACHFGYGGPVNWLLSLKLWKLLSRLSYTMYILHMPILEWLISIQSDDVVVLRSFHSTMFQFFLNGTLITFVFSFIVTVLLEIPILNMYKLLRGEKKPSADNEDKVEDEVYNKGGISLSNLSIQNGNGN